MAERNAGMKAAMLICGLIIIGLVLSTSAAGIAATPTSHNNTTATSTPTPTPTPVPTPAPRQVFSTVSWDSDHAAVLVTNNGNALDVKSSIGSQDNESTTHVGAGITTKVPTMSISIGSGQVIHCWFYAYENGTLVDKMENVPVTVAAGTPTPPPATASLIGMVIDASNNPVAGAEVTFEAVTWGNKYTVTTDAQGQYSISAMVPDTYKIKITAGGYQPYQAMTEGTINSMQQMSPFQLQKLPTGTTPTPTPTPTPSATPGSPLDAWMSLLYSPQACCGTLAVALGAIVSATAIYEWTMRQRERRKQREAKEQAEGKAPEGPKESK